MEVRVVLTHPALLATRAPMFKAFPEMISLNWTTAGTSFEVAELEATALHIVGPRDLGLQLEFTNAQTVLTEVRRVATGASPACQGQ
jgi:hypothetical protein